MPRGGDSVLEHKRRASTYIPAATEAVLAPSIDHTASYMYVTVPRSSLLPARGPRNRDYVGGGGGPGAEVWSATAQTRAAMWRSVANKSERGAGAPLSQLFGYRVSGGGQWL